MRYQLLADEPQQQPTKTDSSGSIIGKSAARLVEGALGLPGDMASGIINLVNYIPQKAAGISALLPYEKFQEMAPTTRTLAKIASYHPALLPGKIAGAILGTPTTDDLANQVPEISLLPPTSAQLRENVTQPLSEKFLGDRQALEPKDERQEFVGDVAGVIPALLNPSDASGKYKTAVILKPILRGVAGKGVRKAIKAFGGGETAQGAGEFLTYLLGSLSPNTIPNAVEQKYNTWKNALETAENTTTKITPQIEKSIKDLKTKANRGHYGTQHKTWMRERINELENTLAETPGKINVKDAFDSFKDLNTEWGAGKVPKGAETFFHDIKSKVYRPVMENWGKVNNPSAYKEFAEGLELFKANSNQSGIRKIINNVVTGENITKTTSSLLLGFPFLHQLGLSVNSALGVLPKAMFGVGAGFGAKSIINTWEPLLKNPAVMKLYGKTLAAAAVPSEVATKNYIKQLDKKVNEIISKENDKTKSIKRFQLLQ